MKDNSTIAADFNGTQVFFKNDAHLNATTIAKKFNKQPRDYLKSARTKEYIKALNNRVNSVKTKLLAEQNQWVIIKHGGAGQGGN